MSSLQGLGDISPLAGPTPAVTMTGQATMLTGKSPREHGIVGNGWLFNDSQEVRFWQQSHQLLDTKIAIPMENTAQIFWWFAQGGPARWKVFPKPHYGCEGSKVFDVYDQTDCQLNAKLGPFPFHAFWGPFAGLASSQWIVNAAIEVMTKKSPQLTMVYVPHLDYEFQRQPPGDTKTLTELDRLLRQLRTFCEAHDTEMIVVSEYGLEEVHTPVFLNQPLREEGWLKTRPSPFGEQFTPWQSDAFAVCDHQIAHVYIPRNDSIETVSQKLMSLEGVGSIHRPEELNLDHPRSGQLIAVAKPGHWFDYRYWLPTETAPDFANTIDIHRKPGYDPCELQLGSKLNLARRILQKKLGFRTKFDIIDTNPHTIRGSHGRPVAPEHGAVIVGHQAPENMEQLADYLVDL
jgi:predicted AlkP superfamily pyrophosphatase or phosphodiesterase